MTETKTSERVAKLPKWAQKALKDAEERQIKFYGTPRCGDCQTIYPVDWVLVVSVGEMDLIAKHPKKTRACSHPVDSAEMWMGENRGWVKQGVHFDTLPPLFADSVAVV